MPKVSIIIPVYNVGPYLRQALDSIVNQTLSAIEIICVDDCSTDGSLNILKEYASKDPRFVIIEQDKNQGAGAARNRALDVSKGEYIMFLDPDDWYELDACETAYNQIKKNNNDIVLFAYNKFIEEDNTCEYDNSRIEPFGEYINCPNIVLDDVDSFYLTSLYHAFAIYRRALLSDNNIYYSNYRMFEDSVFFVKAILVAKDVSLIQKALYNYRERKNSTTFVYVNHHMDILNAKNDIIESLNQSGKKHNLKKNIYVNTIRGSQYWFHKYLELFPEHEKEFYESIKQIFLNLDLDYINQNLNDMKKKTYKEFLFIRKNDYKTYKIVSIFKKIISQIFSLKNREGYKVLIILGIKFKLKKLES